MKKENNNISLILNERDRQNHHQKINNSELNRSLVEKEVFLRNESAEKEYFRNKYENCERERSIEQEVNKSHFDSLKKSHYHELITKEVEKDNLRSVIVHKEREVVQTR